MVPMIHRRSRARESKQLRQEYASTPFDKLRRHKNKERIWRRAVKRLTLEPAPVLSS